MFDRGKRSDAGARKKEIPYVNGIERGRKTYISLVEYKVNESRGFRNGRKLS